MEGNHGVKGRLLSFVIISLLLCECESSGPQSKNKQHLNPRKPPLDISVNLRKPVSAQKGEEESQIMRM